MLDYSRRWLLIVPLYSAIQLRFYIILAKHAYQKRVAPRSVLQIHDVSSNPITLPYYRPTCISSPPRQDSPEHTLLSCVPFLIPSYSSPAYSHVVSTDIFFLPFSGPGAFMRLFLKTKRERLDLSVG